MLSDGHPRPLWRLVIAIAAAAWLVVAGGGGELERSAHSAAPDAATSVLASRAGEFALNADHEHCGHSKSLACLELFATAVLPRWSPTLVALEIPAAVAVVAGLLVDRVVQPGRSPPRALATVITGQDLLTRLCVARR